MALPMDASRHISLARELYKVFHQGPGIFGKMREGMPEHIYTRSVDPRDRVNFLTIAAAMDYQTDATKLWRTAEATYLDPATRWLFEMPAVARTEVDQVRRAMAVHGFFGRYLNNNAKYVQQVCLTFTARYGGSPIGLLTKHGYDALSLSSSRKRLGNLPSLTGYKIFPFWLRMLKDIAELPLKNIEKVPLPIDVHTARATYRVVYQRNDKPAIEAERTRIAQDWFRICDSVGDSRIYPLALDEALWLLSREGCTSTDGRDTCPRMAQCAVVHHCVFASRGPAASIA